MVLCLISCDLPWVDFKMFICSVHHFIRIFRFAFGFVWCAATVCTEQRPPNSIALYSLMISIVYLFMGEYSLLPSVLIQNLAIIFQFVLELPPFSWIIDILSVILEYSLFSRVDRVSQNKEKNCVAELSLGQSCVRILSHRAPAISNAHFK